jgi:hypothetical protein
LHEGGSSPARRPPAHDAEQQHPAALARAAGPGTRTRRRPPAQQIRPGIARVLEPMTGIPANMASIDR